jgi:hypothetical protein
MADAGEPLAHGDIAPLLTTIIRAIRVGIASLAANALLAPRVRVISS